jgi:hypothetical protein
MKKILIFSVILLGTQIFAYAGQASRVELTDGSVINADVVSLDNGTYTLDAGSLGTIKVDASKIRKIESPGESAASSQNTSEGSNSDIQAEMQKYQAQVMNDPQVMGMAQELAKDPQFQEVMNDPQIMEAIKSGNIQVLMSNEKFMNLMNNSKVQDIGNSIQSKDR